MDPGGVAYGGEAAKVVIAAGILVVIAGVVVWLWVTAPSYGRKDDADDAR
jgi:hypothetical protein